MRSLIKLARCRSALNHTGLPHHWLDRYTSSTAITNSVFRIDLRLSVPERTHRSCRAWHKPSRRTDPKTLLKTGGKKGLTSLSGNVWRNHAGDGGQVFPPQHAVALLGREALREFGDLCA
jgi:hypothetical protein